MNPQGELKATESRIAEPTLNDGTRTWSRQQLNQRIEQVRGLIDSTPAGSTALVLADHSMEAVAAVVGAYRSKRRIALVEDSGSASGDPTGILDRLSPELVLASDPEAVAVTGSRVVALTDIPDPPHSTSPPPHVVQDEVLQLTSGSTGAPKFARQTRRGIQFGSDSYQRLFNLSSKDRAVLPVPVVHSYGLAALLSCLDAGASIRLASLDSPTDLLTEIADHASVLFGTPLLHRLVSAMWGVRPVPRHLRLALSAGARVPTPVAEAFSEQLGVPIRQIYGTTEVGLVSCVEARCVDWPEGSAGRVAPGVSTSFDRDGRILVGSPAVFRGYLDGVQVARGAAWPTGDKVTVDADGFLTVGERSSSVVKVGGRRVPTLAVAEVVGRCPGLQDAAVVARRDPAGDDELVAVVVGDSAVGIEDIATWCRDSGLDAHEVPRRVVHLPQLPRTGIHKVAMDQLEQEAIARLEKAKVTGAAGRA